MILKACTKVKFLKVEHLFYHQKEQEKIPEKIQVAPEDLEELTAKAEPEVEVNPELEVASEETEVSLEQIAEKNLLKIVQKKLSLIVNY